MAQSWIEKLAVRLAKASGGGFSRPTDRRHFLEKALGIGAAVATGMLVTPRAVSATDPCDPDCCYTGVNPCCESNPIIGGCSGNVGACGSQGACWPAHGGCVGQCCEWTCDDEDCYYFHEAPPE